MQYIYLSNCKNYCKLKIFKVKVHRAIFHGKVSVQRHQSVPVTFVVMQWRIQDFMAGGGEERQLPREVRQPINLQFFLPKTAWKWKNLDREGAPVPVDPESSR